MLNKIPISDTDRIMNLDKSRSMRQGLIGGLVLSPYLHLFFTRIMNKLTFERLSRMRGIFARVAIH